ncbi:hypothetical protein F5050DRAFT_1819178 [Lentinula boryana]|uniref:Uncharacterized protein n=1 Tax=Lentinula boryana TaxID=40481 RepID=A0ABQ8QCR8_9AGAR|nr:hypothetical protein F5050DRAFT_1819178 [Lentinula boryana]
MTHAAPGPERSMSPSHNHSIPPPSSMPLITPVIKPSLQQTRSQTARQAMTPVSRTPSFSSCSSLSLSRTSSFSSLPSQPDPQSSKSVLSAAQERRKNEQLECDNALLQIQYASALAELLVLKEKFTEVQEQCDAAETHAVLIGQQYSVYKHRCNEKAQKKDSSRCVTTSSRILTSREGRSEIEEETVKRAEKMRTETERQKQKSDAQCMDIVRRAEQDRLASEFSGNMKTMIKSKLIDIAFALKVPHEDVTVDTLRIRLNAHFDANSELKKDPRYIGLFERTRKRKNPPQEANSQLPPPPPAFQSHPLAMPGSSLHHRHTPGLSSHSSFQPPHIGLEDPPQSSAALFSFTLRTPSSTAFATPPNLHPPSLPYY